MTSHTLHGLLRSANPREVEELFRRWRDGEPAPAQHDERVALLAQALTDGERVERRLRELPKRLVDLLDSFLAAPGRTRTARDVVQGNFAARYEVEAALVQLQREGFLFATSGRSWDSFAEPGYAVPCELGDCIEASRRRQQDEVLATITMRGFLRARLHGRGDRKRARATAESDELSDHARKIYKLYLMEGSIENRIRGLGADVRRVFDHALVVHGGLMPYDEIERALPDVEVDADLVRKCLEEAMLGTVAPLRLARFGLQPAERAVVLFHEIVLIALREHANAHPPRLDQVWSAGSDFGTNVVRFLREMETSRVQFTAEGQLYKATEKRIQKHLQPLAGDVLDADTQLRAIWRFCLSRQFVERCGDRGLKVSAAGRDFDGAALRDKSRTLLAWGCEDRDLPGDPFHQSRLRRILLRLLKRLEPERWYALASLAFLARNAYLTRLDELKVAEAFAARFHGGGYVPTETVQQVCWNLLLFVKRRLFPFGLVDLGACEGRPVALRLTRLGAEILGQEPAARLGGERSSVIVNPDFEVLLFPGDDEHEVVHLLDRFAVRTKSDHVHHFTLSKDSVLDGLRDGLSLAHILQELGGRSRAPLPQNVLYSLDEWADAARLLTLEGGRVLRGRKPEQLDALFAQTQVQAHLARRLSPTTARVQDSACLDSLIGILRDLGYAVSRSERAG